MRPNGRQDPCASPWQVTSRWKGVAAHNLRSQKKEFSIWNCDDVASGRQTPRYSPGLLWPEPTLICTRKRTPSSYSQAPRAKVEYFVRDISAAGTKRLSLRSYPRAGFCNWDASADVYFPERLAIKSDRFGRTTCYTRKAVSRKLRRARLRNLPGVLLLAQPVDEHLFLGLALGTHHVAHRLAGNQMTDFLGQVLGVVARPLQ